MLSLPTQNCSAFRIAENLDLNLVFLEGVRYFQSRLSRIPYHFVTQETIRGL